MSQLEGIVIGPEPEVILANSNTLQCTIGYFTFVQFRLALYVSWLQNSMLATTKNFSVLIHVEVPVTGHYVFDRKLH